MKNKSDVFNHLVNTDLVSMPLRPTSNIMNTDHFTFRNSQESFLNDLSVIKETVMTPGSHAQNV